MADDDELDLDPESQRRMDELIDDFDGNVDEIVREIMRHCMVDDGYGRAFGEALRAEITERIRRRKLARK